MSITDVELARELARQDGQHDEKFWHHRINVMDAMTVETTIGYDPPVYAAFNMFEKTAGQVAEEILKKHNKIISDGQQDFENLLHAEDCMYEQPVIFQSWRSGY